MSGVDYKTWARWLGWEWGVDDLEPRLYCAYELLRRRPDSVEARRSAYCCLLDDWTERATIDPSPVATLVPVPSQLEFEARLA